MTDYPRKRSSWKNRENGNKWHSLLALFVSVTLVFALISGIGKSLAIGKFLGSSTWDGNSSVSFIQNTEPPSLVIWQTYPKRLVLLTIPPNIYFATGNVDEPVKTLAVALESASAGEMKTITSKIIHVPVTNYARIKGAKKIDEASFSDEFKKFASIATPFRILIKGTASEMDTDFARKDWINLWWQAKSFHVNDIEKIDSAVLTEEIVLPNGQKVSGVDDVSMHALLAKYMENRKILESSEKVVVQNASGVPGVGKLAADLISALGGSVDRIESQDGVSEKTNIKAEKSYTSGYLAKLFECDITTLPNMEKDQITITLGRDFAQKYSL